MATFDRIEEGSLFEVYQGPLCVQRLDWARSGGAIRSIYVGHVGLESAVIIIKRFEMILRTAKQITVLHDLWDSTGFDSAFRLQLTDWGKQHASSFAMVHTLSRSKVWDMAFSVMRLAWPETPITALKRPEFDVVAKKLGLPSNPPMPQGLAGARS